MRFFISLFLVVSFLYAKDIKFSTLLLDRTSNIELEYKNMLEYLNKSTPYNFTFIYNTSYEDIVEKFGAQKIDIVALNAIEYVKLKRFFPFAKAFVSFYDKNLQNFYTCNGVTKNKEIQKLSQIPKNTPFRLLDGYSTCGYGSVKYILKQNGQNLKTFPHKQLGIDDDIILEILLHPNFIGFEKSSTIEKYDFLDLHIIKTSFKVPPIALIANTHTITEEVIENIQKVLLALSPTTNPNDLHVTKNWNFSVRNGSFIPKEKDYTHLYQILYKLETSKDDQ